MTLLYLLLGIVNCEGMSSNYDINLNVNVIERSIDGMMIHADTGRLISFEYDKLTLSGRCIYNNEIRWCDLGGDGDAEVAFNFADPDGKGQIIEDGLLTCGN